MNQSTNSLEDKLKARLQEYEAPPPPGAGRTILNQVNAGAGNSPWIITLALLFGVLVIGGGFYMTSTGSSDGDSQSLAVVSNATSTSEINVEDEQQLTSASNAEQASLAFVGTRESLSNESTLSNSGQSVDQNDGIESKPIVSQNKTDFTETIATSSQGEVQLASAFAIAGGEDKVILQQSSAITEGANELVSTRVNLNSGEELAQNNGGLILPTLLPKKLDETTLGLSKREPSIDAYEPHNIIVPNKTRRYHFYGDLGVFFLYNHLQPNKNDELIMENFETSGSFSLDRLSYYAEFGVKRDLSRRVTIRAAAVANLFAQKYRFDIRDEASSSIEVSLVDENLFTPVFERQTVSMDHFLVSTGLRLSTDLKVFKSDLNRLMLGLGYHYVLNKEHTFEYKGETRKIEYPHQLTASFGFRKVVWQSDRGELSLLPVLRYGLAHKASEQSALTIKPFSVGLTIGYGFK